MTRFIADTFATTAPLTRAMSDLLRTGVNSIFAEGGSAEYCLPELLDELGVPVGDVHDSSSFNRYRLLDGTFGENMGAANAVSRMQQDCEGDDVSLRGSTDCQETPGLIAVDHSAQMVALGQGSLEVLFTNASNPFLGFGGLIRMPSAIVFAERFPPASEWVDYEPVQGSKFWYGTVTTIDNMWYRIKGGMKLRLLMLRPSWAFSGAVTSGAVGGGTLPVPIPEFREYDIPFSGGPATRAYFAETYAPKVSPAAQNLARFKSGDGWQG
eukprot:7123916-Prymnesium_polylepis.1